MNCRKRCLRTKGSNGFTIVELLVVVAIIGILVGMLMPAVQSVRSAARRTYCLNNHRQIALAVHGYEAANKRLPGVWFDAYPHLKEYSRDAGFFVHITPFFDEMSRWKRFNNDTTTFSVSNVDFFQSTPAILLCPESDDPTTLYDIAEFYGGPAKPGLNTTTGDYRGNKGFYELEHPFRERQGVVPTYVDDSDSAAYARRFDMRFVTDGTSNTILCWDSVGSRWYFRTNQGLKYESWENSLLSSHVKWEPYYEEGPRYEYMTLGTKSYFYGWSGFGTGTVWAWNRDNARFAGSYYENPDLNNAVINGSNQTGSPFSFHGSVCPMSFSDGHTKLLSQDIDVPTFYSLLSCRGGEVIRDIQ